MEPEEYHGKNGVLDSVHEVPGARGRYNNMMDRSDMNRLGKKQELTRNFRLISIFSFMCVVMSTWVFVINASTSGLAAGGTGGFIAVYIGSSFAYFTVVLSLAEMASIAPTAGGQAEFAHPRVQKFTSYVAGWLLTLSWLCGVTSGMFLTGQMVQGAILITNESFNAQPYQVWCLVFAFAASGLFLNTVGARYLALMEVFVAIFLVLGYVVNIIVLWVMSPKNSTSEVFASFDNGNGWSSTGFGILTAQTAALYLILGSDGAAHMAEETFCFCFTTNDLSSVTGFAFMEIYSNATGSNGATLALTTILIILTFFSATNFVASASRQLYAFARDGGLPFSAQIAKVSARLNVPVLACIIAFAFVVLISLIALGSSVAFFAIISLQLIALFFTYVVAIGTLIYRRLRGPPLPEHRWSLGRAGLAINVFAFLYGLFALAFIVLPSTPTVTGATMNWGPVMFAGVMIFAPVYYFAGGHKTYLGPVKLVKDEGSWAR
ncbi:hypothetical protein LTR91_024170 [Friedmanniomyces endolithicus]|uniref:Amino acid permease/ SLC12A domain-containing protein n=1 Tax=Friedmanniomyces endolithicus TaxID=329885 RepID=A0AAN6K3M4_9PEZI|nr:hypothetical protein LTR35_006711 [Friedmanniomyces endolithicus]KAK0297025.1 hypothetical protein LTS00_004304 [Friedmanniomyces endolithicus]KAK0928170.1 hypothetical protein LTR57_002904 [Friedmanniomyces endolithicus]KAK0952852.1 hypothetical protein LTR91_024170 [Friedmanniomyces endolithicus]KAK0975562.1 hypothetical protein LTR54_016764 [Friedmanniomyces endolithicus]